MQLILLLECLRIHSATGIDLPKLPDDFIRKQQQESKAIKAGSRKRSSDGHVVDRPSKRSAVQPESDAIPKPQQAERLYEPGDKEDYVQAGVALMSWVSMLDSLEGGTSAELTKFSEGVVFS
ncbi:hypothetical protein DFJ73DRAFT_80506 [Zopfochytrium polystomum]|nr:hypothetical protein DFJ73DRAFT_80506 [Zopfochytrium polystomum]